MAEQTGWCPSCTCGWQSSKPLPFEVTPPEKDCRNPQCQCHESFWWSVESQVPTTEDELLTRYAYGDR